MKKSDNKSKIKIKEWEENSAEIKIKISIKKEKHKIRRVSEDDDLIKKQIKRRLHKTCQTHSGDD